MRPIEVSGPQLVVCRCSACTCFFQTPKISDLHCTWVAYLQEGPLLLPAIVMAVPGLHCRFGMGTSGAFVIRGYQAIFCAPAGGQSAAGWQAGKAGENSNTDVPQGCVLRAQCTTGDEHPALNLADGPTSVTPGHRQAYTAAVQHSAQHSTDFAALCPVSPVGVCNTNCWHLGQPPATDQVSILSYTACSRLCHTFLMSAVQAKRLLQALMLLAYHIHNHGRLGWHCCLSPWSCSCHCLLLLQCGSCTSLPGTPCCHDLAGSSLQQEHDLGCK